MDFGCESAKYESAKCWEIASVRIRNLRGATLSLSLLHFVLFVFSKLRVECRVRCDCYEKEYNVVHHSHHTSHCV